MGILSFPYLDPIPVITLVLHGPLRPLRGWMDVGKGEGEGFV